MATWYYVDTAGNTKGPHTIAQLKPLYKSELKDTSYIWNGTTVSQWTALNKVPDIWKQIKAQPAPPKPSASPPQPGGAPKVVRRRRRRRSPFGGGGRAALLAGIQKGTKLKKTEPPKERGPAGSPGQGGKKGGGRPLSLMEQMKLAQQNRRGGAKKKVGGVKPKPKPKPSTSSSISSSSSSGPKKMTWKEKQEAKKREAEGGGGGSHGSLGHRKDKIVTKLKNAQEWQLKAIEAILK